jgi:hypothetical protein
VHVVLGGLHVTSLLLEAAGPADTIITGMGGLNAGGRRRGVPLAVDLPYP